MITVIVRYDDCSSRSDTEVEARLLSALQGHNMPCTFGVVPYVCTGRMEETGAQDVVPLTQPKADFLKQHLRAGLLEIALHGFSHQTALPRSEGGWTEFAGLGLGDQLDRIARGKRLLEEMLGTPVRTFIPPWNSYDRETLRALEELGFNCISGGRRGAVTERSQLKFLPSTCHLGVVREAVQAAKKVKDVGAVVVGLCHPEDFAGGGVGKLPFNELEELLDWLASQEDVRLSTISDVAVPAGGLSASQYADYTYFASGIRRRLAPRFMRHPLVFYPSPGALRSMRARDRQLLGLVYGLPALLGTSSGYLVLRAWAARRATSRLAGLPGLKRGARSTVVEASFGTTDRRNIIS